MLTAGPRVDRVFSLLGEFPPQSHEVVISYKQLGGYLRVTSQPLRHWPLVLPELSLQVALAYVGGQVLLFEVRFRPIRSWVDHLSAQALGVEPKKGRIWVNIYKRGLVPVVVLERLEGQIDRIAGLALGNLQQVYRGGICGLLVLAIHLVGITQAQRLAAVQRQAIL